MRKPRVLFSIGLALLPLALAFLGISGFMAIRLWSRRVNATVVSLHTLNRTPPEGEKTYFTYMDMEFEDHGQRRTGPSALLTTDPQETRGGRTSLRLGRATQ